MPFVITPISKGTTLGTIVQVNGSWKAIIRKKGYPHQSKTFKRKHDADKWLKHTEANLDGTTDRRTANTTGLKLFERFRDEVVPHRKGKRWEKTRINRFIKEMKFLALPLHKINDTHFRTWRDERLEKVSAASVIREMAVVSTIYTYAAKEWGLRVNNPIKQVKRPTNRVRRDVVLDEESFKKLINSAKLHNGRLYEMLPDLMIVAVETGMRLGELTSMKWKNVDLVARSVKLEDTKNSDVRYVPLSKRAVEILDARPRGDRVFDSTTDVIGHIFRKVRNDAGLPGVHFHDLRHTAVTRLAKKLSVLELARMIGHRDLQSLMVYYNESATTLAHKLDDDRA